MHADGLFGRQLEVDVIARWLTAQRGGALVLEGPAGIGKTSLWQLGVGLAGTAGMRVLVTRCAEQERHLAYAGLADLLADVELDAIPLPAPQRAGIESALLIQASTTDVNPQAVSSGLLSVLRAVASTDRVLIAVDDLPWLDESTAFALAFAARRLDSVHFLFASRGDVGSPVTRGLQRGVLERLGIGPLGAAEIRQLLHARLGLSLPRRTMQRVVATCAGNPLYALELGRSLAAGSGSAQLDGELPLTRELEDELVQRIRKLEAPTQLLLLAAALGSGSGALALPGIEALADALEAEVVVVEGDRIRPAHPLLGSAAVASATPAQRRSMHIRLAASAADDEHRAHHLALATELPDASVAAAVAAGAASAMHRGAAATAAQLGQHALRLTPVDAPERVERQLTAAAYLGAAGELGLGRKLIPPEIESLPDSRQRVRAYLLAADLGLASPPLPPPLSHRAWTDRALAESRADPDLYASVLAQCAADRAVAEIRDLEALEASLKGADAAARQLDQASELLLVASLAWLRSFRGGELTDLVVRASSLNGDSLPIYHGLDRLLALRQMWRGETEAPRQALQGLARIADERGEAESYLVVRLHLCELELRAGNLDLAEALLDEWAQEEDEPVNAPAAMARCRALLAAYRGHPEEVEIWVSKLPDQDASGIIADRWQWLEAQRAQGLAFLYAGSPDAAAASLGPVWEYTRSEGVLDPGIFPVASDLVEALVGAKAREEAEAVTDLVAKAATELNHPWAAASAKRCGALRDLGTPQAALALDEAATAFSVLGLGFERARTLLILGASYRKQRRNELSSKAFTAAAQAFGQLGSDGWAERARGELLSGGLGHEHVRSLTPTEARIAQLVASGRRNREVATSLFISEKTVESHLSHIYAKLEVRSRTELAARLHPLAERGDTSQLK